MRTHEFRLKKTYYNGILARIFIYTLMNVSSVICKLSWFVDREFVFLVAFIYSLCISLLTAMRKFDKYDNLLKK